MPGAEINLIPEETYLAKEKEKKRKYSIFRLTILVASLAAAVILSAASYSFYLNRQAAEVKGKADIERQKIDRMRKREILLFWTKNKITSIQKILSTKPAYEKQLKTLDFVIGLLGEGVDMTDYSFGPQNVNFTILVSDSQVLEAFINRLLEENKNQPYFKTIKLNSVDSQKDGGYKLSLSAN